MLPAAPKAPAKGGGFFLKRRPIITAGRTGGLQGFPEPPCCRPDLWTHQKSPCPHKRFRCHGRNRFPNFSQAITSRCLMRDSPLRPAGNDGHCRLCLLRRPFRPGRNRRTAKNLWNRRRRRWFFSAKKTPSRCRREGERGGKEDVKFSFRPAVRRSPRLRCGPG